MQLRPDYRHLDTVAWHDQGLDVRVLQQGAAITTASQTTCPVASGLHRV